MTTTYTQTSPERITSIEKSGHLLPTKITILKKEGIKIRFSEMGDPSKPPVILLHGVPLISHYAATESYLLVLAEGLAAEFKNKPINISIVASGFTETNLSPEINFSKTSISPASAKQLVRF
jgi:hypothetical protein